MALFGRETPQQAQRVEAYREWFVRQHPFALASAVLSIFSLTHLGTLWIDEIAGIVLGVLAIRAIRRANRGGDGRPLWLAYVGCIVGLLSFVCALVIYFFLEPAG